MYFLHIHSLYFIYSFNCYILYLYYSIIYLMFYLYNVVLSCSCRIVVVYYVFTIICNGILVPVRTSFGLRRHSSKTYDVLA